MSLAGLRSLVSRAGRRHRGLSRAALQGGLTLFWFGPDSRAMTRKVGALHRSISRTGTEYLPSQDDRSGCEPQRRSRKVLKPEHFGVARAPTTRRSELLAHARH